MYYIHYVIHTYVILLKSLLFQIYHLYSLYMYMYTTVDITLNASISYSYAKFFFLNGTCLMTALSMYSFEHLKTWNVEVN